MVWVAQARPTPSLPVAVAVCAALPLGPKEKQRRSSSRLGALVSARRADVRPPNGTCRRLSALASPVKPTRVAWWGLWGLGGLGGVVCWWLAC